MTQRYSITNRKDSEGPSKLQKPGGEKVHATSAAKPSTGTTLIIVAAVIVVATNFITFGVTFGILRTQIAKLQEENNKLNAELDNYKKTYGSSQVQTNSEPSSSAPTTNIPVPSSTADVAKKATESLNSATLKLVLAPSVTVVVAGSTTTNQPAEQAANSLAFLTDARGPWNWNPTQQQLDQLRTGPYAQYFGDNTIIGVSSNGYAVSYTVNAQGQIESIFITPSISDASSGDQLSE